MKNLLVLIGLSVAVSGTVSAQKYFTKNGTIGFDATSSSSPEKIEGINRSATCVIDTKSGAIQFAVLMKGFAFERALMEEHFNENYAESSKYPKSEFRGKLKDVEDIDFTKDGSYTLKVKGDLTLHGQTKEVETTGTLVVKGGKISAAASFDVKLSDFEISIPGLVADKVAKIAKINVSVSLEPLKN
ncbi:MAG: YceI family protein [Chitinophagaceae bacterium]